eukprot:8064901-Alexandrium_andersonii.AAC.1
MHGRKDASMKARKHASVQERRHASKHTSTQAHARAYTPGGRVELLGSPLTLPVLCTASIADCGPARN